MKEYLPLLSGLVLGSFLLTFGLFAMVAGLCVVDKAVGILYQVISK